MLEKIKMIARHGVALIERAVARCLACTRSAQPGRPVAAAGSILNLLHYALAMAVRTSSALVGHWRPWQCEVVRNINPLHRGLFIGMSARLLADQPQLLHQTADFEATNYRALLAHHAHDDAASRRTTALDEQLVHAAAQCHAFNINVSGALPMGMLKSGGEI